MAYSDPERLIAIEIARRYENHLTAEVMSEIQAALGKPVSSRAVRFWIGEEKNFTVKKEISPDIQSKVDQALDEMFEQTARKMLRRALEDEVIGEMKGRELVTAAAIAVDKMRLLRNMPTEIIEIWPGLMQALADVELNPADVFNAIIAQARAERVKRDIGH